ncbi:MAG: hypothetical protein Q8S11_09820 [Daejeonella sp.]|uniref:hypothetical protein n=1 Tax=Daejeonella sp. TaxID=2805397 RepID=UPI002736078D|nr:hypothetical protein [Daejeonella sp.]MDP3468619.1 hypothetical protein [Daejeonella sp.]
MKNLIIAGILFLLASCGQNAELQGPDDQVRFVNYVKSIRDAVNVSEQDKANRSILLDNGVISTKAYIKDSLSLKFDFWQATVVEIIEKPASIEINFSIILDPSNKSAQKSIIFNCILDNSKKEMIQGFKTGDHVKISGNFIEKEGFIDIDNYSNYKFSKNVFDNPEFKIELGSIE